MKYFFLSLFITLLFFPGNKILAQVNPADSLALVELYNQSGGNDWKNRQNWLQAEVSGWEGITVEGGRVTGIVLPGNGLKDSVPEVIGQLDSLKRLDVSGNMLAYIPAFKNSGAEFSLNVKGNILSFKELRKNLNKGFEYIFAPQDSMGTWTDTLVTTPEGLVLGYPYSKDFLDIFTWHFEDSEISGENSDTLALSCQNGKKEGKYWLSVSNPDFAGMTLLIKGIKLKLKKPQVYAGEDLSVCQSSAQLAAVKPEFGAGTWSIINGEGKIEQAASAVSQVTDLVPGNVLLLWEVNYGGCTTLKDSVLIKVYKQAEAVEAGKDQYICLSDTATLSASLPANGPGVWTVIKGTGVVANRNDPASAVSTLSFGENIFRWQAENNVCKSFFDEVKIIRVKPVSGANAGKDTSICPTGLRLDAELPVYCSGYWERHNQEIIFENRNKPDDSVSNLSEGENILIWTIDNACKKPVSDTLRITVYPFLKADAGVSRQVYFSHKEIFLGGEKGSALGGSGNYQYQWESPFLLSGHHLEKPSFIAPDTGKYLFSLLVSDSHNCRDQDSVEIHVIINEDLQIPQLLTPNHDGYNDFFVIPGIESYPNSRLIIFNQAGNAVFEANPYGNDWGGNDLPDGTYYYNFEDGKGNRQRGYFLITY